jgi:hypothetical protein
MEYFLPVLCIGAPIIHAVHFFDNIYILTYWYSIELFWIVKILPKHKETSQSSNLHFVMVFILRGDRLGDGGKGKKWKKVLTVINIKNVAFFSFFPPNPNKPCHLEQIKPKQSWGLCRERSTLSIKESIILQAFHIFYRKLILIL